MAAFAMHLDGLRVVLLIVLAIVLGASLVMSLWLTAVGSAGSIAVLLAQGLARKQP
jgi:hypothetical protein